MMLFDDRCKLWRSSGTKPLGAKPGMILIDLEPGAEIGNESNEHAQRARPHRFEQDSQAAIDHGEASAKLASVMQQRCLLQYSACLRMEAKQCVQHIDPVPLVIDRQLEEEWRQGRTEERLSTGAIGRADHCRGMAPELSYTLKGAGHRSITVDQRQTPAEFLLKQPKEIPSTVELDELYLRAGGDFYLSSRRQVETALSITDEHRGRTRDSDDDPSGLGQ
jgi:hypothetical protein